MAEIKIGKLRIKIKKPSFKKPDLKKLVDPKYRSELKRRLRRSYKKLLIAGGAAVIVLIIALSSIYGQYGHASSEITDAQENTLMYSYCAFNGKILKYASDSAVMTNAKNETLWSLSYEMNNPAVDICEGSLVIYDKNGTSVIVCDESGEIAEYKVDIPLVKAEVTRQGNVAALQDDGTNAEINYYDTDGSLIATIKTTMSNDGYPMDIGISDDGLLIGVSYLTFNQGMTVSNACIYSFGAVGETVSDNIIGKFTYENEIVPEIDYMGNDKFVAFGTNMISVISGSRNAQEIKRIQVEDEIKSVLVSEDGFAYTMLGNEYSGYEIVLFNQNGKERKRIITDFAYTSIELNDGLITMYNSTQMAVYTTSGVLKYDGEVEGKLIRQICHIAANRYALAAADSYNIIRLH